MSTPILITDSAGVGEFGNPSPMKLGGNLYVILNGITTFQCWESTDNGSTWSRIDEGSEPTGTILTDWNACTDGTTIWVAYVTSGFELSYAGFDTSTGLWGGATDAGVVGIAVFQVAYRSVDDSLIICGDASDVSGLGFWVATIGGSTTPFATCGTNADYVTCWGIVAGTSDSFVFVFNQTPVTAGTQFLQIQSLSSANILGSVIAVDSGSAPGGLDVYGYASAYSNGTTVILAWQPNLSVNTIAIWQAPATTLVFAESKITPVSVFDGFNVAVSIGTGSLLVVGLSAIDELVFYVNTGSGFGPPTVLANAAFVGKDIFTNILDPSAPGGWSMIFTESSGVYYLAGALPGLGVAVVYLNGSLGVQPLPSSVGSLCRFARPVRCVKQSARTILTSNVLVYGGGQ